MRAVLAYFCGLLLLGALGCRHVRPAAIPSEGRSPRATEVARTQAAGGLRSAVVALYAEADPATGETVSWQLPMSGVAIPCETEPLVDARGLRSAIVAPFELGTAVELKLLPAGIAAVAAFLARPNPGRLVLVFEGTALGAARVRSLDAAGRITLFVEAPEAELPELVSALRDALAAAQ